MIKTSCKYMFVNLLKNLGVGFSVDIIYLPYMLHMHGCSIVTRVFVSIDSKHVKIFNVKNG